MLADEIESPGEVTAEELLGRYESAVESAVETVGSDRVVEEAGLSRGAVEAAASGEAASLDLADVAAILALAGDGDADALLAEARERLLLEMSGAMLDVDRLAAAAGGDLDAKEVQAKVEGRLPMTLAEYATLRRHVAAEADW